jgi:hypothetical protein
MVRRDFMTPRVNNATRGASSRKSSASGPHKILLLAYREDLSLKDPALKLGYLAAEQFAKWGRSENMTHPLTK